MWEVICSRELFLCLTTNSWTREDHCTRTIWKTANHCLQMAHSKIWMMTRWSYTWTSCGREWQRKGSTKLGCQEKDQTRTRHFRIHSKVSCSCVLQPLVCLFAWACRGRLPLACLSLWCRDVQGMWCHRKGSSIPWELPAVMEPTKNLLCVLWLLPQVSHPRVSVDW
jgi:hypothetical protein